MFPNLPTQPFIEHRAARVCIATYEILGPSQHGGIGTAYYSLATTLAAANHHVTILFLWAGRSDEAAMRDWEGHFRGLGIAFVPLPAFRKVAAVPDSMLIASAAYAWLRKQRFDIIHFPELHGHGFYCVLAKHQGLDFDQTTLCIGTHSPITWIRERNKEAPYSPEELETDFMERQCVALADVVVSPSQYMLGWMQSRGWILPTRCYVQQNIAPAEVRRLNARQSVSEVQKAAELVFFGRLEARKGLAVFCDALDLLQDTPLEVFNVTFLGKNGQIEGRDAVSYIRSRSEHWRFPHRLITEYGHEAALHFLSENAGRLAIIPSFEDNLPYTVMECLAGSIPFLASGAGGIPELIASSDVERVTFPPDPVQLTARLVRALQEGVSVARPALDADENDRRWISWHATGAFQLDSSRRDVSQQVAETVDFLVQPLVTVCLNYRGDLELLRQSLASLSHQSYPQLEVFLSDRTAAGAEGELRLVTNELDSKGWRLILRRESVCGVDRTHPWTDARGEYVLLMEASDYLNTDAIATFIRVANRTGADVVTSFLALFSGSQEPADEKCLGHYPFLGGAILSGVFHNYFGLRAIFVRRGALLRLGSPCGNSPRDSSDWEFLARAALMDNRIEVIPTPLVWYRLREESERLPAIEYLDQIQALTPYARAMPTLLRDLPKAALTMGLHCQRMNERLSKSPMYPMLQRLSEYRKNDDGVLMLGDEGALLQVMNQMPARSRKRIASVLDGWLEYSSARSQLPPPGLRRLSHIARQLVRGHYHRYAHGFGSALRDLRKPTAPIPQRGSN